MNKQLRLTAPASVLTAVLASALLLSASAGAQTIAAIADDEYAKCVDTELEEATRLEACETAAEAYRVRAEAGGTVAVSLYQRAFVLLNLGRYQEAISDLDAALELNASYVDQDAVRELRDQAAAALAQVGAGRDDLVRAVELFNAGGDPAEIERLVDAAIAAGVGDAQADAYRLRVNALSMQSKWPETETALTALIDLLGSEVDTELWKSRAELRNHIGDLAGAEADYGRVLDADLDAETRAETHRQRALIRAQRDDVDGALEDYALAIEAAPSAVLHYEQGELFRKRGAVNDATYAFDQAMSAPDASPSLIAAAWLGVALTNHEHGDPQNAVLDYHDFFASVGEANAEVQGAAIQIIETLRERGLYDGAGEAWDAEFEAAITACVEDPACRF